MIEVRCKGCDKKILLAVVFVGAHKCSRCKRIYEYNVHTDLVMNNSVDPRQTRDIMRAESKRPTR